MKKAAEFADEIIKSVDAEGKPNFEVIKDVLFAMAKTEPQELMKMRNIKFDRGLIAVLKEQNNKWKAIVRRINNDATLTFFLKEDAFVEYLKVQMPDISFELKMANIY